MNYKAYIPSRKKNKDMANKDGGPLVSPYDILCAVEKYFEVSRDDIIKKCRRRVVLHPRQLAMWLMRHYTSFSINAIGVIFERDHTTVTNYSQEIDDLLTYDERVKEQVESIKKMFIQ